MTDIISTLMPIFKSFLKANVTERSKRWDASKMPDLTGRVAIVTGGNTGLGYVSCLEIARHHGKVYMACRNESKAKAAINKIKEELPEAQVEFLYFDLTILSTAKKAAEEFNKKEERLDILMNNAGIMMTPYELSPDGIELQACNGTGHFALTKALLPILKKTSTLIDSHVRIVNLSSLGHNFAGKPDFSSLDNLNNKSISEYIRYGQSKLTNVLFNNELQKVLHDTKIYCLAVHPGIVATELGRGLGKLHPRFESLIISLWSSTLFFSTPYDGAQTQLYAATSPEIEEKDLRGAYLVPYGQIGKKSKLAQDLDGKLGQDFWNLCEKLILDSEQCHHSS
ncbi:hypothetical protein CROQUDRAFT_653134 [Cronartium quercuum f. sp. fusiforme G11]|uniref:NAD(P)-binding protein n=1 Tax=Cronartium quercuum f. sp. fusiforme G11 TaxID=708437 RepID=A0A9P6TFE3_9BASI|nr:hypothetical protein CROQUDRAFT_653134 [Cronartium quercuum f. sp. fusiforme G11]